MLSYFKLTIILAMVLFVGEALAQCNGRTVYLQTPSDWPSTSIDISWTSSNTGFTTVTVPATKQGNWLVFTVADIVNDNNTRRIVFSSGGEDNSKYIGLGTGRYNTSILPTDDAQQRFTCNFTSQTLYIYEDGGRVLTSASVPNINAFTFYFLPPRDERWIIGIPYIGNSAREQRLEAEQRLDIDESCGWFKKVYESYADIPAEDAWIWLGATREDQVGLKGMGEDPTEWKNGNSTPFNLRERFNTVLGQNKPGKLYFFADEGDWRPNIAIVPEEEERCTYRFAAIIYDTDAAVNTSFHAGQNPPAVGISKNIPLKELVFDEASGRMKMQFNTAKTTNLDGWTKANFDDSFRPHETKNVVRCYDMPFKRNRSGQWEFNSNKLCSDGSMDLEGTCQVGNTNNSYLGGYFPTEIQTRGTADYSKCEQCDKLQPTSGFRPLSATAISQYCYDRGYSGNGTSGNVENVCGAAFTEGNFSGYGNPNIWANADQSLPSSVPRNRNSLLCFESAPTEFEYEPGQEFFFSGDDDIWVFINNKMVIDLGGTHVAAPAYVNLDTLGLTPGEKYPINIFFCDRRVTQSNVRISTNMYFKQSNGLYLEKGHAQEITDVCLETLGEGGSCSSIAGNSGPSKQCGADLKDKLNYFIVRRDGSGRKELNKDTDGCTQEGNVLKCFGSITIDFSLGKVEVKSQATGLVGTWVVYSEIKPEIPIEPRPAPLRLGSTSGVTVIQVVWGKVVVSDKGTTKELVNIPHIEVDGKRGMEAVASKLVPVAFALGAWTRDSSSANAQFEIDSLSPGQTVTLQASSFKDANLEYSGLKVYKDPEGLEEVFLNESVTIPKRGEPSEGVLVLYFTGTFDADSTATYNINSRSSGAPFALKVYQPRIEFVDTNNAIIPKNQRFGSDPSKPGTAIDKWIYVGNTLSRNIAAFDPTTNNPMEICETCTFTNRELRIEPFITNKNSASGSRAGDVIIFPEKKLENGLGSLTLHSTSRIQLDNNDSSAYFIVGGPSRDANTIARWDSLQFREPPVPYPVSAEIYDRNGDGRGDSIRIVYNRRFHEDSLPNKLQVVWSLQDTVSFGLAKKDTSNGQYTNAGFSTAENKKYWIDDSKFLKAGSCADPKDCGDTIIIAMNGADQFTTDIKTAVHNIGEAVISWSTFMNDEGVKGVTNSFSSAISDKIPPIVVAAEFEGQEDCGLDVTKTCRDRVFIELSEPVAMAEGASEKAREAFAYKLISAKGAGAVFEVYNESKSLPRLIRWANKRDNFPEGDSSVVLTYASYKIPEVDESFTPVPNDSVRLLDKLGAKPEEHAFRDLAGNAPNLKEIGRRIEGRGRFSVNKNIIADVDPETAEESLKNSIISRFKGIIGETIAGKFREEDKHKPIALLPVPDTWQGQNLRDSLQANYPGTVGAIFWPGSRTTIRDLDGKYCGRTPNNCENGKIPREKIFFVANSFYHTNLGNYTAKSGDLRISCKDPIFKIDGATDCAENPENRNDGIYMGWDLRDNKGRWVGTGAYVQVYNFYWEIKDVAPEVNGILNKYPNEGNKVEMYGVRRVVTKK